MPTRVQSPTVAASVQLHSYDHDGYDGRYGVRCWRGAISIGPDELYGEPAVEIGRVKMYTADLRFGDELPLNLDDISAELGSIGEALFDDVGECVLVDEPYTTTMAVVDYVQLAQVWRGDGIGPAAAILAANMVANDLSVLVVVPGRMNVQEDCVTGALTTQRIRGTFDEVSHHKIVRAFRAAGFTAFPGDSHILYLVAGTHEWRDAVTGASERLASIPATPPRQGWLAIRRREPQAAPGWAVQQVDREDFDWSGVDRLLDLYSSHLTERSGEDCWASVSAAAADVTRQMLDSIDGREGGVVEVTVTFTDVRANGSSEDVPEWFIRGEPLSCPADSAQLGRLLHLVAVAGGHVSVCRPGGGGWSEVTVFHQRIVTAN